MTLIGSPILAVAIVADVAATWHDYAYMRDIAVDGAAPGLIVHVAGPTDEGFRTIDVWASESLWLVQQRRIDDALSSLAVPPVVRRFHVRHLVVLPGTDAIVLTKQETQP